MQIALENIEFENDFYEIGLEDGNVLRLNKIDESLLSEDTITEVKRINIEKIVYMDNETEDHRNCVSIIGLSDSNVSILTAYNEYLGKPLDSDNMKYCVLEV